jgi:hypothetical protein
VIRFGGGRGGGCVMVPIEMMGKKRVFLPSKQVFDLLRNKILERCGSSTCCIRLIKNVKLNSYQTQITMTRSCV